MKIKYKIKLNESFYKNIIFKCDKSYWFLLYLYIYIYIFIKHIDRERREG